MVCGNQSSLTPRIRQPCKQRVLLYGHPKATLSVVGTQSILNADADIKIKRATGAGNRI
jgi:hypothetical protein